MKTTIKTLFVLAAVALVSCNSKRGRNYQYFPNMYESVGYEAYSSHESNEIFAENNTSEALKPVEGTVHRGWLPYDYKNSNEGYQAAKAGLKNPLPYTKANQEAGKQLYSIYCAICHGDKGNGKGHLVKSEKILGVPSYDDVGRAITQGSIYHVMYYGINSMGSYASQTSIDDRWKIVQYVQKLKADLEGKKPRLDKNVSIENTKLKAVDLLMLETNTIEVDTSDNDNRELNKEEIAVEEISEEKEKISYSKKDLLGGKSHHSHKETGKK